MGGSDPYSGSEPPIVGLCLGTVGCTAVPVVGKAANGDEPMEEPASASASASSVSFVDRMAAAAGEIGWVYDDGGREAAGIEGSVADDHIRAAAVLTGCSYTDIQSLCWQRLAQFGYPDNGDWNHAVRQGSSRKRPPQINVVWEREVMEHDLGLLPHKVSGAGPLPTFGEAWTRFGDCIVLGVRYYTVLIDAKERDLAPRSRHNSPYAPGGSGLRRAKKVWTLP